MDGRLSINSEPVPSVDSATNATSGQVVGNKNDTVGGTSLVSMVKGVSGAGDVSHVPLFTGTVYYVDAGRPDDSGTGLTPEAAKQTIAGGIAVATAGDAITVKAGTYTENVALAATAMELWGEIGAVVSGVVTVTADSVRVRGVIVTGGVVLTGNRCVFEDSQIVGGAIALDINGFQNIVTNLLITDYTATGIDVANYNTAVQRCTVHGAGAGTRGIYLSNTAADRCTISDCVSVANDTAGYEVVAGCESVMFVNCSSGGVDGLRVDAGTNTTWANYSPAHHAPLFGGTIWYVHGTNGADTNSGQTPDAAFATIGAALTVAEASDAINVAAGTYDEDGLDMAVLGLEMWGEIGANIINTVGTECLTVSGNYCRLRGFAFHQAGVIGVVVSGYECVLENCRVEDATVSFDIDGDECEFHGCVSLEHTTTGFDIATDGNILTDCTAIGDSGARRGYYLSAAGADSNYLARCGSIGNGTAGYEAIATATNNTFKDCSSGGGDGGRVGLPGNVWSNYTFDDEVYKTVTFTTTGAQTYNLFQLTGTIEVETIWAVVETVISANMTAFHVETWDGTASVDITKNDGVISALPVGSFIVKEDKRDKTIEVASAAAGALLDQVDAKKAAFRVIQKTGGVATYIRLSCTSSDTPPSGVIQWHCKWSPLSDDGFLGAV